MAAPSPLPSKIYKILPSPPPSMNPHDLPTSLPLSDLDFKDGFIHLSTARQVPGTCSRFFGDVKELWFLVIDYASVASYSISSGGAREGEREARIKWEDAGHGDVFPHWYGDEKAGEGVNEGFGFGRDQIGGVEVVKREEGEGWGDVLGREKWLVY